MKTAFPTIMAAVAVALLSLASSGHAQNATEIPLTGDPESGAPAAPTAAIARNRVISIMPGDKRPLLLKGDERNPFARRNPDVDLITEETEQETEADFIRDILNSLPITGRSYGPRGLRILAGEIIFERGKMVDQVIEGQTENLIVENISDHTIELAWIDMETGKLSGKRLTLTYDLTPKVRYQLKGPGLMRTPEGLIAGSDENEAGPRKFGVLHSKQADGPTADQIVSDKLPNNIPAEVFTEGQ